MKAMPIKKIQRFKIGDRVIYTQTQENLDWYVKNGFAGQNDFKEVKSYIGTVKIMPVANQSYGVHFDTFAYRREDSVHWKDANDIELLLAPNDLLKEIL